MTLGQWCPGVHMVGKISPTVTFLASSSLALLPLISRATILYVPSIFLRSFLIPSSLASSAEASIPIAVTKIPTKKNPKRERLMEYLTNERKSNFYSVVGTFLAHSSSKVFSSEDAISLAIRNRQTGGGTSPNRWRDSWTLLMVDTHGRARSHPSV